MHEAGNCELIGTNDCEKMQNIVYDSYTGNVVGSNVTRPCVSRGAVVEWLEYLTVVLQKVAGLSLAWVNDWKTIHCPPSSEWVPD